MPDEKPSDDVEKVLADLKGIEGRKQALIDDLHSSVSRNAGAPASSGSAAAARRTDRARVSPLVS
jgi:hypothetical protein